MCKVFVIVAIMIVSTGCNIVFDNNYKPKIDIIDTIPDNDDGEGYLYEDDDF
jgi:hypothetical protein